MALQDAVLPLVSRRPTHAVKSASGQRNMDLGAIFDKSKNGVGEQVDSVNSFAPNPEVVKVESQVGPQTLLVFKNTHLVGFKVLELLHFLNEKRSVGRKTSKLANFNLLLFEVHLGTKVDFAASRLGVFPVWVAVQRSYQVCFFLFRDKVLD